MTNMRKNTILNAPLNISAILGIHKSDAPLTNRHYVTENSYDLAPVDQIIWASIQEEINGLKAGEKLAVIIGECHPLPTHILPQIGAVSNLALWRNDGPKSSNRNFLYALEQPYNYLANTAEHLYNLYFPPSVANYFHHHDPSQQLLSKAMLVGADNPEALTNMPFAPISAQRRYAACIQHKIPIIFNDAACQQTSCNIDPYDEIALRIAQDDYGINLFAESVPMAPFMNDNQDIRGVAIRHGCMVARSKEYTERIIVQQCGAAHPYGNQYTGSPYKTALIPQYERAGYKTLGISFGVDSAAEDGMINPSDLDHHQNHIIIDGLSPTLFDHTRSEHSTYYEEHDPALLIKEQQFIGSLIQSYSLASCPFEKRDIDIPTEIELRSALVDIMTKAPQI